MRGKKFSDGAGAVAADADGGKCDRKHDTVCDQNQHWAVAAEMVRRGGCRKRHVQISPDNIDGMADQMREGNKRTHGGNPIIPTQAWRGRHMVRFAHQSGTRSKQGEERRGGRRIRERTGAA